MSMMAPEIPPELMAALQGGGAPPGGPPPGMAPGPAGPAPPQQEMSSADALTDLIQVVQSHPYLEMEQDPEDVAALQTILAQLTKLKAKQQKEDDAAMGVGPAQRAMRRATVGP